MAEKYSKELLKLCKSVKAKRPKTVIDHILKHGQITTEELKEVYGYNHPPRAVRDVRERGIPIETFRVEGSDGRKIAAYKFGKFSSVRFKKYSGRTGLSKKIKDELINKYGSRCFIYLEELNEKDLQIDHRIPFEITGESKETNPDEFMLLCGSANRAKSWSCENCENWKKIKKSNICLKCYWAYPENYEHIAMKEIRRADILWQNAEVLEYQKFKSITEKENTNIPKYIKQLIKEILNKK